jgi:hypothetical protein
LSATGSIYLAKFSRLCMARPPEMMILAEVSSGRSDLASFLADEARKAGIGRRRDRSIGAAAAVAGRLRRSSAHRDDLLGIGRFTVWIALPA